MQDRADTANYVPFSFCQIEKTTFDMCATVSELL